MPYEKHQKYARLRDTNIPPAKEARLPELWRELGSVAKVAKELEISRGTVYRLLRKKGLIPE